MQGPVNRKRSAKLIADEDEKDEGEKRFIPLHEATQPTSVTIVVSIGDQFENTLERGRASLVLPLTRAFCSRTPHGTTQKTGKSKQHFMRVLLEPTRIVIFNLIY